MSGWLARRVAGRLPSWLLVLVLVLEGSVRLVLFVFARWWLSWPLVFGLGGWALVHRYGAAIVVALLVALLGLLGVALGGWQWLAPTSFDERVLGPWRSWRRRRAYNARWEDAMHGAGLVRAERVPTLVSVRGGPTVDEVLVHMAPGQLATEWRDAAQRLVSALEVRSVRVRKDGPRDVLLLVRHSAVSWRESREEVDAEIAEVTQQPVESLEDRLTAHAERIVAALTAPTEVHDVPRPGAAFPRRPR